MTNEQQLREQYRAVRQQYDSLASAIGAIINQSFSSKKGLIHKIEMRSKDEDSFIKKCNKTNKDGTPKYSDPFKEITDKAGVRIIVFTTNHINQVVNFIKKNFNVTDEFDLGEKRFEETKQVGYKSYHLLAKFSDERIAFDEYSMYNSLECEIQIRTIIQHAWAEIEHDIQYKASGDLPTKLGRKFNALAGLLEIGDREFQGIVDEYERIAENVEESLNTDLTKQVLDIGIPSNKKRAPQSATSVAPSKIRDLVNSKKYNEAISTYSDLIQLNPAGHTLYVGRAKAKSLNGDRSGALEDLDHARNLVPDDPSILAVRRQIDDGTLVTVASSNSLQAANEAMKLGNSELEMGNGTAAFMHYDNAQGLGFSFIFCIVNKILACIMANDLTGADNLISLLKINRGTPMEINMTAIRIFLNSSRNIDIKSDSDQLNDLLTDRPDYNFNLSPLKYFESGLISLSDNRHKILEPVFSMLKNPLKL